MNLDQTLIQQLNERKQRNLYRSRRVVDTPQAVHLRVDGRELLSFCSNDYLGLANHPKVKEAFIAAASIYGVGSGASHLVSGHSKEHHLLEEELAAFVGRERALLFSTGYMANIGAVNALLGRRDAAFEDKLNHASLLDARRLSGAACHRFRHNDMDHLRQHLASSEAVRRLILVDGVFSMDGDMAPLPELHKIAEEHNAWLMVDDAHGLGCLGDNGGGCVQYFGLGQQQIPVLMGTLGKAFGTFGAFVAGSEALIETLIQFSRTYIYTTALPPAIAAATRASLRLVREETWRREHLTRLIQHFRQSAETLGLPIMNSFTPIQPVLSGEEEKALRLSRTLERAGFWVPAIRPPTVPAGTARLRIILSAEHTVEQVDDVLAILAANGE